MNPRLFIRRGTQVLVICINNVIVAQLYQIRVCSAVFSIRKDLSRVLKVVSVFESLTRWGKTFQSLGPKTVRDHPPLSVRVNGTRRLCLCRVVQVWREISLSVGRCMYHSGNSLFYPHARGRGKGMFMFVAVYLKHMHNNIENNLSIYFEPLKLSYEGGGMITSPCSSSTYFSCEVLELLHLSQQCGVGGAAHTEAVLSAEGS